MVVFGAPPWVGRLCLPVRSILNCRSKLQLAIFSPVSREFRLDAQRAVDLWKAHREKKKASGCAVNGSLSVKEERP